MKIILPLLLLMTGPWLVAQTPSITVTKISGKAQVQRGEEWVNLTTGQVLSPGDTVSTGFRSELILQAGPSTITMKALSRLTVKSLLQSGTELQTDLYLRVGMVDAEVNRSQAVVTQKFKVDSPVATASVRGTSFVFDTVNLEVTRGLVDFSDFRGFQVAVPMGGSARASLPDTKGSLTSPKEAAAQESQVTADAGSQALSGASSEEEDSWGDWSYEDILAYLNEYYWAGDLPVTHLYLGGIIPDGVPAVTRISIGGIIPSPPPLRTIIYIGGIEP